jgi:hypothetical protein
MNTLFFQTAIGAGKIIVRIDPAEPVKNLSHMQAKRDKMLLKIASINPTFPDALVYMV